MEERIYNLIKEWFDKTDEYTDLDDSFDGDAVIDGRFNLRKLVKFLNDKLKK